MTLPALLQKLCRTRFSGVLLLHFQNGLPKLVEFPKDRLTISPEVVDKAEPLRAQ